MQVGALACIDICARLGCVPREAVWADFASAAALPQETESTLEGGVQFVTAAVRRCLQFYVSAGAITRKTEESLRSLLSSLQDSQTAAS